MDKKQKLAVLNKYLGKYPVWFDQRKKEILRDRIDIKQWQINMNFLINNYRTIDSLEKKAFEDWRSHKENEMNNEIDYFDPGEYLSERATTYLLYINEGNLPQALSFGQDMNWFLAAYPDVFGYFYPQKNPSVDDFDKEILRFEEHMKSIKNEFEHMTQYLESEGKGNQTHYLIRMKNYYKNELKKNFFLSLD